MKLNKELIGTVLTALLGIISLSGVVMSAFLLLYLIATNIWWSLPEVPERYDNLVPFGLCIFGIFAFAATFTHMLFFPEHYQDDNEEVIEDGRVA